MPATRYLGLYTLLRGGLYFLPGAGALVVGTGSLATGVMTGLGPTVLGVLYLCAAFSLFLSGGLLMMKRKIGRLLAILFLSIDVVFNGLLAVTAGSTMSLVWAVLGLGVVGYLVVRNPVGTVARPEIDEETSAHEIGFDRF